MLSLNLQWKYIIWTTIILLLIISAFAWQNLKLEEKHIADDDRERVVLITEIIKNGLITIMLEGRGREFQKFLEALIAKDIEEVRIFAPDGIIISSSRPSEIGKKIYREDLDRFTNQEEPEVFSHIRDGRQLYSMVVPIYNERACQRCHGAEDRIRGILDVEISMAKTQDRLASFRRRLLFFSFLMLVTLSVALSLLTKYLINRPIQGIMHTMKQAESGDLNARFHTDRADEVGNLSESLNSMLARLDSAQKELEGYHQEEIQRIEKMATIGELASAIAHEIKNPLAGISGAMQVFAEDFSPSDPRKEVVEDVIVEIERLDKAVRDLLNFARPPLPHPLVTDARSLMDRLVSVVAVQARKQNVSINVTISPEDLKIHLDPEQFQQVFLNIVLNAIHAMPKGGTLAIDIFRANDSVEFHFSDTGTGILEKDMKNLFKPFFTTKNTGTGLGLAISKSIVEQHGGTIYVESLKGSGTTFSITIPAYGHEYDRA